MRTAFLETPVPVRLLLPDGDTHIAEWLLDGRWYERRLLDDMQKQLRPGQRVVDVGAHIGNHTLWMAAVCGLEVLALEPNPAICEILRANVELNGMEDRVEILEVAAGARSGRGILHLQPEENSGTTVVGEFRRGDVSIIALDDLELTGIAAVKIDVEGMELEVLAGMRRLVEEQRPFVYVEVGRVTKYYVHRWFLDRGYERYFHLAGRRTLGYRSME